MLDRWSLLDTADPGTAALAAEAKAAIDSGRYDQADALLVQTEEQDAAAARQGEQLARDAQQAAERRWLNWRRKRKRGDLAMTRLRYADAALRYAAAANTVPTSRQDARRGYLVQEAEALYQQGDERGDNTAAQQALTITTQILQQQSRDDAPLQWAGAERNRGLVLTMLGERESGTEHLEEAVSAHSLGAGGANARTGAARLGGTQNNLADALLVTGRPGSGTARLEEAVAAFRAALGGTDARSAAARLGGDANSLGNALDTGERQPKAAQRMEEAVTACLALSRSIRGTRAATDATPIDKSVVIHGDGSRVN